MLKIEHLGEGSCTYVVIRKKSVPVSSCRYFLQNVTLLDQFHLCVQPEQKKRESIEVEAHKLFAEAKKQSGVGVGALSRCEECSNSKNHRAN